MNTNEFYRTMTDTKEFRVAMEVAYWLHKKADENEKFSNIFSNWYRDREMMNVAYTIYETKNENIEEEVNKMVDLALEGFNFEVDVPIDDDELICWLGVTAGEYCGLPDSEEKMEFIRECVIEFEKDFSVGYLAEIFDRKSDNKYVL